MVVIDINSCRTPNILGTLKLLLGTLKLCIACIFCLTSLQAFSASVIASLNKNSVVENEIVQLSIRTDFPNTGSGPDLTPLKRDFDILGQSQNSQFRFNLGTSQALNFWVINLMPKSVGKIEIPSIKVGEHQSEPLILDVKSSPQLLDQNGNAPVILKMTSSEPQPYLQQQVILTMELYTSVALQNANISTPNHANLIIERLVDDQLRNETINGTTYQVLTREFLAFPQVSGVLDLPPQTISAMINTSTGRRVIKVQSLPIALQVLPIPASYSNDYWLPANNVIISSKLNPFENAHVGDTLIWEIMIDATGVLPEQIPPIAFSSTSEYKLYPQPAKFNSQKSALGINGSQSITIEVVPTQSGEITLPSIEIPFWNSEERSLEVASSESISLNVLPLGTNLQNQAGTSNNQQLSTTPETSNSSLAATEISRPISLAKNNDKDQETSQSIEVELEVAGSQSDGDIKIILLAIISMLTLIVGAWLYRTKRRQTNSASEEDNIPTIKEFAPLTLQDEKAAYSQLLECCHNNQINLLRGYLLEWARIRWGDEQVFSLEDIKRLSNSAEISQLIMESELIMYSDKASNQWDGQALAEALEQNIHGIQKDSPSEKLKTLYPNF